MRARITPLNLAVNNNSNNPTNGRLNNQVYSQRDQQLILLLICEVFLYVCTNLLYSINITYSAITSDLSKSIDRIRIESFIAYFSTPFLIIINNCAPFYLYIIVSRKFRQDVKRFFSSFCFWNEPVPTEVQQTSFNNRLTIKS